jgi:hypothetical protein
MNIHKGYSRAVILVPFLGIALKFPIIRILDALNQLKYYCGKGLIRYLKLEHKWTVDHHSTIKMALGKGLRDNWQEFRCSRNNPNHKFLMPTYFSLFGLMNVQKLGQSFEMEPTHLWLQMIKLIGDGVWKDSHTFAQPNNFCKDGGRIRVVDYGNPQSAEAMIQHGENVWENFTFDFDAKEYYRQLKLADTLKRIENLKQEEH